MSLGSGRSPEAIGPELNLAKADALLGAGLTPSQQALLGRYLEMLQRWNAIYNLTSVRDPSRMLTHHLYDCLAVVPAVRRRYAKGGPRRLLDVGSGAGLPGVVLAIALPAVSVTCVDSVGKKAAFVRQVAAELGISNLSSLHGRVEQLDLPTFDLVVSRAYASLVDFVRTTRHLIAPGGSWLAMKGKTPTEETAPLEREVVFHVEQLEVPGLAAERCLVWMEPLP